jgi:signal peptidase I
MKEKVQLFFKIPYVKLVFRLLMITLLLASLLLNWFTYVTPIVKYYGNGMSPTLTDGQVLILAKTKKVSAGDVIAFYYNNKVLVRRVVCEGGKQISMDISGRVSVNGEELEEPYVDQLSMGQCTIEFPYNVPLNEVFVLGDNRTEAMDSRLEQIGTISNDRIIGKVLGL